MADLSQFEEALQARAKGRCELCGAIEGLRVHDVGPGPVAGPDRCALVCSTCGAQIDGEVELGNEHWYCLREAAWSEVPAVQVISWRLLQRLGEQAWALDLLGQVYLADEVLEWAKETGNEDVDPEAATVDSNGTLLVDGDSVTLIKDLDVKGTGFVAKRGTVVKNIRLTDSSENIEGRVNKTTLVLKTKFLKKVG